MRSTESSWSCPSCGSALVRATSVLGSAYFHCSDYPVCREAFDVGPEGGPIAKAGRPASPIVPRQRPTIGVGRVERMLNEPLLMAVSSAWLGLPRGAPLDPVPPRGKAVLELFGFTSRDGWIDKTVEDFQAGDDPAGAAKRACEAFGARCRVVDAGCQLRCVEGTFLFLLMRDGRATTATPVLEAEKIERFATIFASGWAEVGTTESR